MEEVRAMLDVEGLEWKDVGERVGCSPATAIYLHRATPANTLEDDFGRIDRWLYPTAAVMADPVRRATIEQGTREIFTAVRLAELCAEAGLTEAQLAARLGFTQENVSRIERAEDTQLSTIRRYVEALVGNLELHAVVDGRDVPIAAA